MKQKDYLTPGIWVYSMLPEEVLCTSKFLGNSNEGFGNNGVLDEVIW